jgi:hypothetical protein
MIDVRVGGRVAGKREKCVCLQILHGSIGMLGFVDACEELYRRRAGAEQIARREALSPKGGERVEQHNRMNSVRCSTG